MKKKKNIVPVTKPEKSKEFMRSHLKIMLGDMGEMLQRHKPIDPRLFR